MIFTDRQQAGSLLAEKLKPYKSKPVTVVGLARGGVVVACAIATKLELPLDILVVKKIPSPYQQELAVGALAPDGVFVVDWKSAQRMGADEEYIKRVISDKREVIKEKTLLYRKKMRPYALQEKTVILTDDGAATGATIEAAIKWCKKKHAHTILVALPVLPQELIGKIRPEVSELIYLDAPESFSAVGQFYKDFPQVEDRQVAELLQRGK